MPTDVSVGDCIELDGRRLRVCGMPDGRTLCRDHRGRIAVRNVDTNRLSYVSERRIMKELQPVRANVSTSVSKLTQSSLISELLLWLDDSDATAQFESIAEKFYRETGYMRPGKSMPFEMHNAHSDASRVRVWHGWCKGWKESLIHRLRALQGDPPLAGDATHE